MTHKRRFFGPFFGFDWGLFASKSSLFLAFQKAKPFVCNKSFGLFRQKNIFFPFPGLFPHCRVAFALPCRVRFQPSLATTPIGYHKSVAGSREKCT